MEAFSLVEGPASFPSSRFPGGADLISSMGTGGFARGLFDAAHALTNAHHLTAFAFSRSPAPRVLVAENMGAKRVSSGIAPLYVQRFWQQDLANRVTWDGAKRSERWLVRTVASEISQDEYKYSCYTSVNLGERVCVSVGAPEECTRLNFYCQSGRRFTDRDLDNVAAWSGIFISLLLKHASLAPDETDARGSGYKAALARHPARLPERELEVCDGILQGISSEGIALKLGVSINTVRTYRKRAYARLGISSQNELMRLAERSRPERLA